MTRKWYLALDGDDIGTHIERCMLTEDETSLEVFTSSFKSTLEQISMIIHNCTDAEILLFGGDSILIRTPPRDVQRIIQELKNILDKSPFTFSGGYGRSMRDAYLALKIAKVSGKNQYIDMEHEQ